jgi:hypothetical protein
LIKVGFCKMIELRLYPTKCSTWNKMETHKKRPYLTISLTHSISRNSSFRNRSICISIRFSIGAISGNIRPMFRNDSTSHRRRIAAKRLQSVDIPDIRPLIYQSENLSIEDDTKIGVILTSQTPTRTSETEPLRESGIPWACATTVLIRSALCARRWKNI